MNKNKPVVMSRGIINDSAHALFFQFVRRNFELCLADDAHVIYARFFATAHRPKIDLILGKKLWY